MSVPRSVIKINKNGVKYVSNVDRANYTIRELTRAALRDVGKFICNRFRKSYYSHFRRRKGRVSRYTQYWVRTRDKMPNLQVGLKPGGFYGAFQEKGTVKINGLGLLEKAAKENINEIIKIEAKYLSAMEDEARALGLISEEEYTGGGEDR